MQKLLVLLFVSVLSGVAHADELADAMKAWEKQDFQQAHQIFSKLAKEGNAEAQLQLGEMVGFGEGVPEDSAQAEHWLKLALAGGNKDAAASLEAIKQRAAHKADIAHFVSAYDGADFKLEKFGCVKPVIPEVSKSQADIKAVSGGVTSWLACYDGFAKNLNSALPAGKAIPADIAKIMSVTELRTASSAMDKVYAGIGTDARAQAVQLIAANDAWLKRTKEYSTEYARTMQNDTDRRQREMEQDPRKTEQHAHSSKPAGH